MNTQTHAETKSRGFSLQSTFAAIRFPGDREPEDATKAELARASAGTEILHGVSPARGGDDLFALETLGSEPYSGQMSGTQKFAVPIIGAHANIVYKNDPELSQEMDALGYDLTFISRNGVQAYVAMERDTGQIFVAFRGTEGAGDGDSRRNLNGFLLKKHPDNPDIKGHPGYINGLFSGRNSVADQVDAAIEKYQATRPDEQQNVFVTGHSAGAGMAGLYAIHDKAQETPLVAQTVLMNPAPFTNTSLTEPLNGKIISAIGDADLLSNVLDGGFYKLTHYTRPVDTDYQLKVGVSGSSIDEKHGAAAILASSWKNATEDIKIPFLNSASAEPSPPEFAKLEGVGTVLRNGITLDSCEAGNTVGLCLQTPNTEMRDSGILIS